MHHDIVIAAAKAGKMIVCEKPLAMNVAEAEEMVAAVEKAGVANMVSFNYRRVPAISLAKQIIDEGRVGRAVPLSRDLQPGLHDRRRRAAGRHGACGGSTSKVAGSGVTGDLLAHSIDTAEWLNGPIQRVVAHTETFIKERKHADTGKVEKVDIDDACMFLAVFENGSMGTFESTRYARGRKNYNTFEINGENGAIFFDLEDPHILQYFQYADPADRQEDRRPPDRLAADPRHQFRASLHEALVGAGLHDRLRAHVHQRPGRLPRQPRRRPRLPAQLPRGHADPKGLRRRARQRPQGAVGGDRVASARVNDV